MDKQPSKTVTKSTDDIENCRVVEIGIGDFAECAQWGPVTCGHAMSFGFSYLCMHPRVSEIMANTKKALAAKKI